MLETSTLRVAIAIFKLLMYPLPRASMLPASAAIPEKVDRNLEVFTRYIAGERAKNWLMNWAYRFDVSIG